MVMIMMHSHHHHQTNPPPPPLSHHNNPSLSSSISLRSPNSSSTPTTQPHSFNHLISLGRDNYVPSGAGTAKVQDSAGPVLSRVKLSDILPYDGSPVGPYVRAVEALSGSLMRHNAAVIEVGCEGGALLRCGLESARFFFRTRAAVAQSGGGGGGGNAGGWNRGSSSGLYVYRPGRYSIQTQIKFSFWICMLFLILLYFLIQVFILDMYIFFQFYCIF